MARSLFQNIVSFASGVSEAAAEKTKREDELLKERVKSLQAAALEQNKTKYAKEVENHYKELAKRKAVESAGVLATQKWMVETGQAKDIETANQLLEKNPGKFSIPEDFWNVGEEPVFSTYTIETPKAPSAFGNLVRSVMGREPLPSGEEKLKAQMQTLQAASATETRRPQLPEQFVYSSEGDLDKKAKEYKQRFPLSDDEAKTAAAMDAQIRLSQEGREIDIGRSVYERIKGSAVPQAVTPRTPQAQAAVDSGIPIAEPVKIGYEESKRIETSLANMATVTANKDQKGETVRFLKENEEFSDRFKKLKGIAITDKPGAEQAPFADVVADYSVKLMSLGMPRQASLTTAALAVSKGIDETNSFRTDIPIVDENTFAKAWLSLGKPEDTRFIIEGLNEMMDIAPNRSFGDKVSALQLGMDYPGFESSLYLEALDAKRSLDAGVAEDPSKKTLSYEQILQRLKKFYSKTSEQ